MHRHNNAEVLGVESSGQGQYNAIHKSAAVLGHHQISKTSLDAALPKQFVVSMKKLFDILDDQRTGFVRFADIQKGWQDDGCKGLPRGVIESLRKVTPINGMLSFDRFCAGLKICLLRNQNEPPRPPSAPVLEIENPIPNAQWGSVVTNNNTATVRPHNIVTTQRALSLPQLRLNSEVVVDYTSPPPPPKPPRSSTATAVGVKSSGGILATAPPVVAASSPCATNTISTTASVAVLDKTEIRHALQNWQMGILLNEMDAKDKRNANSAMNQLTRGTADGGSSSTTDNGLQSAISSSKAKLQNPVTVTSFPKKATAKRREPRRHTLQNGIDYNLLKRLKQFEEERDVLLQGMSAVENAREWYIQQIASVQEKIKFMGRMGSHVEQWSEVHQERLDFQRARVMEVNRYLATLIDTWERGGFPMHFNLAIRPPKVDTYQTCGGGGGLLQPVDLLKKQNRNLTNEVNIKSNRISLLEREKKALIRDLLELQQRRRSGCSGGGGSNHVGLVSVVSQSSPACSSSSGGLGDADVVY